MPKDQGGKTVSFQMNVWYDAHDGSIHVASKEAGFISTINNKLGYARCHPHLFGKLTAVLRQSGKPAPDRGA